MLCQKELLKLTDAGGTAQLKLRCKLHGLLKAAYFDHSVLTGESAVLEQLEGVWSAHIAYHVQSVVAPSQVPGCDCRSQVEHFADLMVLLYCSEHGDLATFNLRDSTWPTDLEAAWKHHCDQHKSAFAAAFPHWWNAKQKAKTAVEVQAAQAAMHQQNLQNLAAQQAALAQLAEQAQQFAGEKFFGHNKPANPSPGALYVNQFTGEMYMFDGMEWQPMIAESQQAVPLQSPVPNFYHTTEFPDAKYCAEFLKRYPGYQMLLVGDVWQNGDEYERFPFVIGTKATSIKAGDMVEKWAMTYYPRRKKSAPPAPAASVRLAKPSWKRNIA